MSLLDPSFWSGAGAAVLTVVGGFILRHFTRRESLEERLQRWQEQTVERVNEENKGLRAKCERLVVVETCLKLVVAEIMRIQPNNPVLGQVGAMLSQALPLDPAIPDDLAALLHRIDEVAPSRRARKGQPS